MSAAGARGPVCLCNRSHKKLLHKSAAVREDTTTSYHSPRCMSAAGARGPVCLCNRSHKKLLYKSAAVRGDTTTSYHIPRCMSATGARVTRNSYIKVQQSEKTLPQAIILRDVCLQQARVDLFVSVTGVTRNSYIKVQQ
ncbi:hypothetical protein J6590_083638 [Homalodisca vitripennis]|nr:hypothetical protein J6590_083638 [Homalodisca vitripennis]